MLDAGVVDENVDRAEFSERVADHLLDRFLLRQVRAVVAHGHAVLGRESGAKLFDGVGVAETVQHDVRAVGGKRGGDSQSDTAGRSGDQCRQSLEHGALRVLE